MSEVINALNWRYAVKQFNPEKKVSKEDLDTILAAVRLAPSAYGLQPLKILVVENPELRAELRSFSYNQPQVTDASHLLVLCTFNEINEEIIKGMIEFTAEARGKEVVELSRYHEFLKGAILPMDTEEMKKWNDHQVYIALGHLLQTCAHLRIDSTPMEGFQSLEFDRILSLTERNLHSVVVCPIGYRSDEDANQYINKARRSLEDLVEFIS
jgi:nitroreductase / dihydropteridine reductase